MTDQLHHCVDADAALRDTLRDALQAGTVVGDTADPLGHRELLAYQFSIDNPQARITTSPSRPLNVISAVARFVWMIAANDRLADIAVYEPKVSRYTDDGLIVPGSSYGRRIGQARPGLNQLSGVVTRLRTDPGTRRAATVIWSPEDAVRDSNDIPCAFGTFYHMRDGGLTATTVMRSNNAFLLLPFNIFEFSLLAEMVAAEVGAELRQYVHWAASMHVLNREFPQAERLLNDEVSVSLAMPRMPSAHSPLAQGRELAALEAELRMARSVADIAKVRAASAEKLDPYWGSMLDVLATHHLSQMSEFGPAFEIVSQLPDHFRPGVSAVIERTQAAAGSAVPEQSSLFDEFLSESTQPALNNPLDVLVDGMSAVAASLEATGESVTREEYAQMLLHVSRGDLRLAARSEGQDSQPSDAMLTLEEARALLAIIRSE